MSRLKSLFTNPAKRPQFIIWLGVVAVAMVLVIAGSVVGTSTNWFCIGPCHKVHDDNTLTYNKGSHVMVSCIACHEPLNGSPLTFILMKMEVAPDAIPTLLNTYKLPMNEANSVALEMPDNRCVQCHNLKNRTVTASAGIVMNHEVHEKNKVSCTSCHNRVAHPEEDVEYVLKGDKKHENWMTMDACFRCHSLESGGKATGECAACHTPDFNLVPASHSAPGWYQELGPSGGHAAAYSEEASRVAAAEAWSSKLEKVEMEDGAMAPGYAGTVNTCFTCHKKQFCTDCHGVEMPHPADFKTNHGKAGLDNPASCAKCHARSQTEANGTAFCNACHHPDSTPDRPWIDQHFDAVRKNGAQGCFDCHNPRYCSACHVDGPEAAARVQREDAGY